MNHRSVGNIRKTNLWAQIGRPVSNARTKQVINWRALCPRNQEQESGFHPIAMALAHIHSCSNR